MNFSTTGSTDRVFGRYLRIELVADDIRRLVDAILSYLSRLEP
ncbi:hypothetical protein [Thermoproteus tenax]|nr:hypothetical protein [Thermoproteus tenax]